MKKIKKFILVPNERGFSKDGYDFEFEFFDENNNSTYLKNGEEFLYLFDNQIYKYINGNIVKKS